MSDPEGELLWRGVCVFNMVADFSTSRPTEYSDYADSPFTVTL